MTNSTIEMRKEVTKEVAKILDECFDKVTPTFFTDKKVYATFNVYRQRWKNGTLGEKPMINVLKYFGYTVKVEKEYIVTKKKGK